MIKASPIFADETFGQLEAAACDEWGCSELGAAHYNMYLTNKFLERPEFVGFYCQSRCLESIENYLCVCIVNRRRISDIYCNEVEIVTGDYPGVIVNVRLIKLDPCSKQRRDNFEIIFNKTLQYEATSTFGSMAAEVNGEIIYQYSELMQQIGWGDDEVVCAFPEIWTPIPWEAEMANNLAKGYLSQAM